MALVVETGRLLAPLTTLALGGPAAHFVEATSREALIEALAWADAHGLGVRILGGGSNLVVADEGVEGLVVRLATRGIEVVHDGDDALVTVQAGEPWDDVVELAVSEQLAGIECLSGIPGSTGATPIQNVGAYGQEVGEVVDGVEVLERATGASTWWSREDCGFSYRDSRFKREAGRFVVLAVRLRLVRGGAPAVRYAELSRALSGHAAPPLRDVQTTVRALRASKGMLIDSSWEPSAGSFFTNPVVSSEDAERVTAAALRIGCVAHAREVPRYAADDGRVKLAAGWLIEKSGVVRGMERGAVGVSARHALALVHRGGGTTRDLMALAAEIQEQVMRTFGVALALEPVRWP